MTVSRETRQLERFAGLIRKWNPTINLVSPATVKDLEVRHITDSLQLAEVAQSAGGSWSDLGSGGGLPGVVLGIVRPDLDIVLLESDKRKGSFLRTVIRELGLSNVKLLNQRIEDVEPMMVENISARALAPLPLLLSYVVRHLKTDGTAWLMKGKSWHSEVEQARASWRFDMTAHNSKTDPEAAILELTSIRHE